MGEPAERRVLVGRYEIVSLLGRDRRGTVYRGRDLESGRPVAIKLLEARRTTEAQAPARFRREESSAVGLSHANVVTIYDSGVDHGDHYVVTELVDGGTLEELLRERGRLPVPLALALEDDILRALASAHEAGLLHGDVSPGTVMVTRQGVAKLTDFGIARSFGPDSQQTGSVAGPAACLAPELSAGGPLTAAADVYGAGCVLYAMLTGQPAFSGGTPSDSVTQQADEAFAAPSALRADLPPVVDALVAKALKKRPEDRFESAREMLRALQHAPVLLPPPGTRDAWQRPPEDEAPHEWPKTSITRVASSRPRSGDTPVWSGAGGAAGVAGSTEAGAGVGALHTPGPHSSEAGQASRSQASRGQIYPRYIPPDRHVSRPLMAVIAAIVIASAVIVSLAAIGVSSTSPFAGTPPGPVAAPGSSTPGGVSPNVSAQAGTIPAATAAGNGLKATVPAAGTVARPTAPAGTPLATTPPATTAPSTTAPATPSPTPAPSSTAPAVGGKPDKEPKTVKPGKGNKKGQTAQPSATPTPTATPVTP